MGTKFRLMAMLALAISMFSATISASAQDNDNDRELYDPATPEFQRVWERTDFPVEQLVTARTWIWGPGGITPLIEEPYEEADGGERRVQYFDKSRMEMPLNGGDPNSPWFVTQGLLATELMTGRLRLGDDSFEQHEPADIPVAGDPDDVLGPTYATMGSFMDWGARPTGSTIVQVLTSDGTVFDNDDLAIHGVTDAHFDEVTGHNIASVFWDFMNSEGAIYVDGQITTGDLFQNPYYAVGRPLTEAYWGWIKVNDVEQNVLIQCFERRCLTYTPNNPEGWRVESGNIGLHYYNWRYEHIDREADDQPEGDQPDGDQPEGDQPEGDEPDGDQPGGDEPDGDQPDGDEPEFAIALAPEDATNNVGETHTLTATVTEDGEPVDGATVTFEVTEGPHSGESDVETTDASGDATFTYTGTDEGTDTIRVVATNAEDIELATGTATKTWVDDTADEGATLTLAPLNATNDVGDDHTVLATLVDGEENPIQGATVEFEIIDGPHVGETGVDTTDQNGEALFTYTGDSEGDDTITATAEYLDVDENVVVVTAEEDAIKTWVAAPEQGFNMTMEPADDTNPVGTEHIVTVTLTNNGQPVQGYDVEFTVTGDNAAFGEDITDANGQAEFAYTGDNTGNDVITAEAYEDIEDPFAEPVATATASKTWVAE